MYPESVRTQLPSPQSWKNSTVQGEVGIARDCQGLGRSCIFHVFNCARKYVFTSLNN